jgi:hypothetical protein
MSFHLPAFTAEKALLAAIAPRKQTKSITKIRSYQQTEFFALSAGQKRVSNCP